MNFSIWMIFSYYVRPIVKWFLRRTTGLCELQRVCYGEISGGPRVRAVEYSLMMSKSLQIQQLITHLNNISDNQRFTGANEREILRGAFVTSFGKCIEQIWGYRQLIAQVEELRTTAYDSENNDHEKKLHELWERLMPQEKLDGRITKQWQDIGFQGDDPKTDFRGMGMLGLDNLLFFATEHRAPAAHVLSHSHHPVYGYCFAIVGINLTSLAWVLLKDGSAKTFVYNNSRSLPSIRIFHNFYCYLFYEFDRFWLECKPKDIMEFSKIKNRFESNVRLSLQDSNATFRIGVTVDDV